MNKPVISPLSPYWRTIVSGLLCLFFLSSCSMKYLYHQLDWIIPQFIDDYIPLDTKQEQALQLSLKKTLIWHRSSQLPVYVHWLKAVKKDIKSGLSPDSVARHSAELEKYWKALLAYIADDTSALLYSTSQEQRDTLFEAFKRKNSKYQKKNIEPQAEIIRNNRATLINDEYERWLGYLEPSQQHLIQEASRKMKPIGQLHLDNRIVLQNKLKYIFKTSDSYQQFRLSMKDLLLNWEKLYSNDYRDTLKYNKSILINLTSDISTTLNKEQKEFLFQKIDYYITIFNELSSTKPLS